MHRARIRQAYLLVYGRVQTAQEVKLGIEYLKSEPLRDRILNPVETKNLKICKQLETDMEVDKHRSQLVAQD